MHFQTYVLPLLATASTISAQAMINWAFYEPGSGCGTNWRHEPSNEAYWTGNDGDCIRMVAGEYDVVVDGTNVGLNAIMPAMYACPDARCELGNCVIMAAEGWSGQGMGCQHMHQALYWFIEGVFQPVKRETEGNETEGWNGEGFGPREVVNETKVEKEPRLRKIEFKA